MVELYQISTALMERDYPNLNRLIEVALAEGKKAETILKLASGGNFPADRGVLSVIFSSLIFEKGVQYNRKLRMESRARIYGYISFLN